ncbi:MAG: 4Fe-4S dicluster domain-containing protein [Eubacteriales bacterium]
MSKVEISEDTCKGCGMCVAACPKKILVISKSKINTKGYHVAEMTDSKACIGCMACATMCPDIAIEVEK